MRLFKYYMKTSEMLGWFIKQIKTFKLLKALKKLKHSLFSESFGSCMNALTQCFN